MERITGVWARMALDSRGNPTVEAVVKTKKGQSSAIAPSGASVGAHEAIELRDRGKAFLGKGVQGAIDNINGEIARALRGMNAENQSEIDSALIELDGTGNKSRLGANAMASASMACCRAGAMGKEIELYEHIKEISGAREAIMPIPMMNVINGGMHAGNDLDFQEFMLCPLKAESYSLALQMCAETYQMLRTIVRDKFGKGAINMGDEGGFAPPLKSTEDAIKLIQLALKELGYEKKVGIALDAAGSSFYREGKYFFEGQELDNMMLVERVEQIVDSYGIASIEDPFAEDDWQAFCALTTARGNSLQVVGDDLLVTRVDRIERAKKLSACNAGIIKINQVGTVSEAIGAINALSDSGMKAIVSHRSGDSEDSFIADFAVGTGTSQAKFGAPARSERTAKYNRLLRIEEALGKKAKYSFSG